MEVLVISDLEEIDLMEIGLIETGLEETDLAEIDSEETTIEILEETISIEVLEKCIRQFVLNAEKNVKFLLNLRKANQSIVTSALKSINLRGFR